LGGDINPIRVANNVNIQDGAILHTLYQKSIIEIGDNVTIAHNAVIHGARISSNVLIGIGAVVLDHAIIGENSIIADGAVILSHTVIEPGSIFGGNPVRKLKNITHDQSLQSIERIAENYKVYADWYSKNPDDKFGRRKR
jgi:carbonic anhydrase/acetyltransferase-like protein (isoleucine patch superfamily)